MKSLPDPPPESLLERLRLWKVRNPQATLTETRHAMIGTLTERDISMFVERWLTANLDERELSAHRDRQLNHEMLTSTENNKSLLERLGLWKVRHPGASFEQTKHAMMSALTDQDSNSFFEYWLRYKFPRVKGPHR